MNQQKRERQADVLSKTPKLSTFFKSIDCPPDDEDQNSRPTTPVPDSDNVVTAIGLDTPPAPAEVSLLLEEEACEPGTSRALDVLGDRSSDLVTCSPSRPGEIASTDIACSGPVTNDLQCYWINKGVKASLMCQNKEASFTASERVYKNVKRYLSNKLFTRECVMESLFQGTG